MANDEAARASKKIKVAKRPTRVPLADTSNLTSIVDSLTETNKLLHKMNSRMEKYEERMRRIEDKIDSQSSCPSSSGSTPARKRSKEVPLEVRVSLLLHTSTNIKSHLCVLIICRGKQDEFIPCC